MSDRITASPIFTGNKQQTNSTKHLLNQNIKQTTTILQNAKDRGGPKSGYRMDPHCAIQPTNPTQCNLCL